MEASSAAFTHPCTIGKTQLAVEDCMMDTCAGGGNYIDASFAEQLAAREGISIIKLARPREIMGYDGDRKRHITTAIYLRVKINDHTSDLVRFNVTKLASKMIIGMGWMERHGAIITTHQRSIHFQNGVCDHVGAPYYDYMIDKLRHEHDPPLKHYFVKPPPLQATVEDEEEPPYMQQSDDDAEEILSEVDDVPAVTHIKVPGLEPLLQIKKRKPYRHPQSTLPKARTRPAPYKRSKPRPEQRGPNPHKDYLRDTVAICQIGAAPFRMLARDLQNTVFSVSMQDIIHEEERRSGPKTDPKSRLPKEYHDLAAAFDAADADVLPPHRDSDHHIDLEGQSPPKHAPLYRLSDEELALVKAYIEDNLNKGFIKASSAPWASPILFVKKPGGGLRFCVDYRKLNALTRKDRYPLPLIDEVLAQMFGSEVITKLDIRHAFNRIRMKTELDEDLTTFKTRFGTFKYMVMPFGLCNGPATFQRYINEALWEHLNVFCTAYIDDILIYSKRKDHVSCVRKVLQKLIEHGLQADIDKCEFHVEETKFLGLIISIKGMKMDPEKVATIINWPEPKNAKEVLSFTSFCSFYRRFIANFSRTLRPLTALQKKGAKFDFNDECGAAFQLLKDTVVSAPVLLHFDPSKDIYVETDASDFVVAGVLSQMGVDGLLHPIAFFSRKMNPAQCNYEIYDKELLAIVESFENWRPELEGATSAVKVLTDHQSLQYFMTTKKLTRRQARWALFLSQFNFVVTYRPGIQNGKADALTRRHGDRPEGDEAIDHQRYQEQTILDSSRVSDDILTDLKVTPSAGQQEPRLVAPIELPLDDVHIRPGTQEEQDDTLPRIQDQIKEAQSADEFCQNTVKSLREGTIFSPEVSLPHCTINDLGLLCYRGKIWIPDINQCRTRLLEEIHVQPSVGHCGVAKMLFHLQRHYYWPRMDLTLAQYCSNCQVCKRAKPSRAKPEGILNPLPIPMQPWQDISLDFVTGLPSQGNDNAILNVVCRLTKERHFIPCQAIEEGTTAEATAWMLIHHVWKYHGLPNSIVSDRGPQFIAEMWLHFCRILKIKVKLSTAFHPEFDGQTEIANAEMERFLRTYVNYMQDDWKDWLPMAEFAINNSVSASTGVTPFFSNKGYHPRMSFDPQPVVPRVSGPAKKSRQRADDIATKMIAVWEHLRENTALAQLRMEEFANRKRSYSPNYQVGNKVYLSTKNIKTVRPSKKLDDKAIGPFTIIRRHGVASYELDLPKSMKIHPVFHSSLLKLDPDNPLPGQQQVKQGPVFVDDEGEEEWEVKKILDSKLYYGKLQYKADWVGQPPDPTFYDATVFDNAKGLIDDFHLQYPRRPNEDSVRAWRERVKKQRRPAR